MAIQDYARKISQSTEIDELLAAAEAVRLVKAAAAQGFKEDSVVYGSSALLLSEALAKMGPIVTKLKRRFDEEPKYVLSLVVGEEEVDERVKAAAIAEVRKRFLKHNDVASVLADMVKKTVATWFFRFLVHEAAAQDQLDTNSYSFTQLMRNAGDRREQFFRIWVTRIRELLRDPWGTQSSVMWLVHAYVTDSKATTDPVALDFVHHAFLSFPTGDRSLRSSIAKCLIEHFGAEAAEIFDIVLPAYVFGHKSRSDALLHVVGENGGMVGLLLIRLEKYGLGDTSSCSRIYEIWTILIFFAQQCPTYRARVDAVLAQWIADLSFEFFSGDVAVFMSCFADCDSLSEHVLDNLFSWIWRSRFQTGSRVSSLVNVADQFAVIADKSKYPWSRLSAELSQPRDMTPLQMLLISAALETVQIPRWVADAAKTTIEQNHSSEINLCAFTVIHSMDADLAAEVMEIIKLQFECSLQDVWFRLSLDSTDTMQHQLLYLLSLDKTSAWDSQADRCIEEFRSRHSRWLTHRYAAFHFLKTFHASHRLLAERLLVFDWILRHVHCDRILGIQAVIECAQASVSALKLRAG